VIEGDNRHFRIIFKDEFVLFLDRIEDFFAEQGTEPLQWWYDKETEIIDHIERILAANPFAGPMVERGSFKGLRRIAYGESRHMLLNYLIYYAVHERDRVVDVINILPSRSKRKRVTK
jgi:hypothetical protein